MTELIPWGEIVFLAGVALGAVIIAVAAYIIHHSSNGRRGR